MNEVIKSIPKKLEENYWQCFPSELLSRSDLEKLRPNIRWPMTLGIKDPNLTQRADHGFGHIARIIINYSLLMPKLEKRLEKEGVIISKEQKAALLLSELTHDLGHKKDFALILGPHQKRSANSDWLKDVFLDLKGRQIDLFQNVSMEKVVTLASQINRVHDERDDKAALKVLNKEYGLNLLTLPLEVDIFKDLDSGLERLRAEEWFRKRPIVEFIGKLIRRKLLNPSQEKSMFHLLHFPHFKETWELLPFAILLYKMSTTNPEYKIDQWKATMDTAQMLGAIKA